MQTTKTLTCLGPHQGLWWRCRGHIDATAWPQEYKASQDHDEHPQKEVVDTTDGLARPKEKPAVEDYAATSPRKRRKAAESSGGGRCTVPGAASTLAHCMRSSPPPSASRGRQRQDAREQKGPGSLLTGDYDIQILCYWLVLRRKELQWLK